METPGYINKNWGGKRGQQVKDFLNYKYYIRGSAFDCDNHKKYNSNNVF